MTYALVSGLSEFNGIGYGNKDKNLEDVDISTILRLFNLGGVSDEDLEKNVSKKLGMDLNSGETIKYINKLYQDSIKTYQDAFLIDLKAPFSTIIFKDKGNIVEFLRLTSTSSNKERRQIYCDLIKIMFCYHEVEINPVLKNAEKDTKEFVAENYLIENAFDVGKFKLNLAGIMEKKEEEDYFETEGYYYKKMPSGQLKRINCILRFRGKSAEKIVIKMLGSEKGSGNTMEIISDSMGVELEGKSKTDSIYLLEYEYFVHKERGNISQTDFRQKLGFYNETDIEDFIELDELDNDFKDYLRDNLKSLIKNHGTAKYQDCKLQGMVTLPNGHTNGLESRVVRKGNKNQSGLSASKIIDGKKTLSAMIGLRGWVSKSYINRIIDKISSDPDVNKDAKTIFEEFIGKLVKVPVPNRNRNIYSSRLRLEEVIKNASEYPDFIVNAIGKAIYPKSSIPDIVDAVKRGAQDTLS